MTAYKIIGIAGTNGSGKDTVGQLLMQEHKYLFVSGSDMLRNELKKQKKPLTRENTRLLSSEWRRQYGLGIMIDKAREVFISLGGEQSYNGLAIASLRSPAEADRVHEYGGIVIWLDADPKVRYERIRENASSRGSDRAVVDNVSFSDFIADEMIEMGQPNSNDPTTLSMSAVKAKSDKVLVNEGNNLQLLSVNLNQLLGFS